MMADGLDLGAMLSKISENPEAREMLSNILGAQTGGEDTEGEVEASAPPSKRSHSQHRREMLLALRPYLSTRRSATIDRMIRAIEVYDIIEQTRFLKGGR